MGLNQAQKEAVEYLEGPLLVLAGPGTGKTQLLSEKVAYILKNTDTNPENILCLTFTESGASNMRERLRGMIKSDALKVNIGTYHAFGREILAQYQGYAENYTRVLDNAVDEINQYKIVRGIMEALPAFDILRNDNVRDVLSVISEAKSAGLSAADLAKIANQNIEDAEVIAGAISPLLANVVPRQYAASLKGAYEPIYEVLSRTVNTEPIVGKIERSITGMARDLAEAIAEATEEEKIKPLTAWKDKYFEKDEQGNYRLRDRVANRKLLSLAGVMEKYQGYLEEHGLYDFDDMIEEAVRVLKTDEGFKLTLEERYQFIMLDEFQDTNPSQFAIVKELTDYEKPQIMAVGDDDQAIYEFQGALASNLTDFQEYYHAKVISLTENYRSTQEILDFARKAIEQAPDRFADKELVAHKKDPAKSQIRRIEFQGSDAEYEFIAEEITRLIQAGVPQDEIAVISYKTKYFEPLLPYLKDRPEIRIAYERRDNLLEDEWIHQILTILAFADSLAHEQKSTEQLIEILTFKPFGLDPVEIVKLAGRARREHRNMFDLMLELPEDAAEEVSEDVPGKRISEDAPGRGALRGVVEWLAGLVPMVYNEPLDVVVHEVFEKLEEGDERLGVIGADRKVADDAEAGATEKDARDKIYEKYVRYENLAALMGKVREHFGEQPLRVGNLLEMVQDYEDAGMQLTGSSPYRDTDEAVQILTAHKAKGLEFQHVFIISADHTAWGKGKGNNNLLALPKNLTQIRHTGTTDSERLRVLYVALTRAKEGLTITNSRRDFNGKSPERLEYLQEYEEGERVLSPFLPAGEVELRYEAGGPEKRLRRLKNWLEVYKPKTPEMRALYRERVENWRMSASALTSFIDVVYAGPAEFFSNYLLRAPREPENEALAFGDLVHKTFEAVTNQGLSDEQAIGFYLEELDKKDLQSQTMRVIREKGTVGLGVALEKFGPILRHGQAEVDFGAEKLVVNGVPITGKIDHITVNDEAKTIELYDFKTGGYHPEKWQSNQTLYKYMIQLGFYKLLLNNSEKYRKYEVQRAHILFVTPDTKDREVHDKIYEFNAEDEKDLLEMMRAVYDTVTSLKFLDDRDLWVQADQRRNLKDIKEFIELLVAKNQEN